MHRDGPCDCRQVPRDAVRLARKATQVAHDRCRIPDTRFAVRDKCCRSRIRCSWLQRHLPKKRARRARQSSPGAGSRLSGRALPGRNCRALRAPQVLGRLRARHPPPPIHSCTALATSGLLSERMSACQAGDCLIARPAPLQEVHSLFARAPWHLSSVGQSFNGQVCPRGNRWLGFLGR
jgi:hypothetical protein